MAGSGRHNADSVLIAALAGGATVQDAASRAGVSERTAYHRLEDPLFVRQVAEARSEMLSRTVAMLAEASTDAAATLRGLLADDSPPAVRLGACRAILELGVRLRESEELEARIAALEAQQAAAEAREQRPRRWPA